MSKIYTSRNDNSHVKRSRRSAGSAKVPHTHGNIVAIQTTEDRMYLLNERGISSGVTADQIDPDQTNPDIPHIVQREEIAYGAEHAFVRRTVGITFALAEATYLPEHINKKSLITLSINVATRLSSVFGIATTLENHVNETNDALISKRNIGILPKTPNLKGVTEQCISDLRKSSTHLKEIINLFYPKDSHKDGWDKKLKLKLKENYGDSGNFDDVTHNILSILSSIENHRHAMIHPGEEKSLNIFDYELNPDGTLNAPSIEIIHPDHPIARQPIPHFLRVQAENFSFAYEHIVASLFDMNAPSFGKMFSCQVKFLEGNQIIRGSHYIWETLLLNNQTQSSDTT